MTELVSICRPRVLERGKYEEAIECFTEVLDPKETPKFFLHWLWCILDRVTSERPGLDQIGQLLDAIAVKDLGAGAACACTVAQDRSATCPSPDITVAIDNLSSWWRKAT